MSASDGFPLEGGCDCREVRYRMMTRPLFVHCCHCRWCQRETGSAFVINAMIEAERVELVAEYYDRRDYWPKESLDRREAMLARKSA